MNLLKRWHPKVCKKKKPTCVCNFVDRIDKSVPQVTVWHHEALHHEALHHSAEPRDAKQ